MLERCRFEQSFTKAAEKNLRYPALHGLRMHHSICHQICYTLSASDGHHNRLLLPTHKNQCVLRTDWQTTSRLAVSTDFFSLHSIHPCELRTDWQTTSRLAVSTDFFSLHSRHPCVLMPDCQTTSRLAVSTDFFSLHIRNPCLLRPG